MKRIEKCLVVVALLAIWGGSSPARSLGVHVVHRGPRGRVVVRRGFPLHRRLPRVVVRRSRVAVRVEPRVYLPHLAFRAVVLSTRPEPRAVVWHEAERLDAADEWTEFTLNLDRHGTRLDFEIGAAAARVSFAEVVFENGDTRVVDFGDRLVRPGYYTLLDFADGRKVDHVRVVARADRDTTELAIHLIG